ncbi:MAG: ABC transporter ATP-binding protein [Pelagimonas sp.]|jgi:iron complex transport system ATP-binding protein|nr:ABC transporter ATP-binding protein [Pelagimonas sp.]
MSILLEVQNLGFHTQSGAPLLRDVTFDLPKGAVLAIAGPNGAGKTTLLNLLSGMSEITHGDVRIDGQSLRVLSPLERARKIATVSQQSEPDGRLALQDYVALGQMPIWGDFSNTEHREALAKVLDLTGIAKLADKPMGRLSGGEKQRAHIARALVQRPQLLFLDEPTNHLDPDAKGRMLSLVAGLGITVVTILHDLVMIPEFASHVALVKDARLTDFGPVDQVLTPEAVRKTFDVDYLLLPHNGRQIPALDIRKTEIYR